MNSFSNSQRDQQKFFPYNLKGEGDTSDLFYVELEKFSHEVITAGLNKFREFIRLRRDADEKANLPVQKAENELLDILIAGTLWNEYAGRCGKNHWLKYLLLNSLFRLRKRYPSMKARVDRIRGKLVYHWLSKPETDIVKPTSERFNVLISWLNATGEYPEECRRIKRLIDFTGQISPSGRNRFLSDITAFSTWFKFDARGRLGNYTRGVRHFLSNHPEKYAGREDYFFCGKQEVEYHLNMVGAAILNHSLKKEFDMAENKVLLLPACMAKSAECKASVTGKALKCFHCTPGCNISETTRVMAVLGVETVIVKHSSDFSKWLKPWANQKKTALIGTACVLNLLGGGYEMIRLGIPSQCVFLDYCGCRNHWNEKGIPTQINLRRVPQLIKPVQPVAKRPVHGFDNTKQNFLTGVC